MTKVEERNALVKVSVENPVKIKASNALDSSF